MILPFSATSNFKLKTSLTGCIISHLDACNFMERAHPSYAHIIPWISLSQWVKFEPKFYAQILHQISNPVSLWTETTKTWLVSEHNKKENLEYKKKGKDDNLSTRNTRQIKAWEHKSQKNITIRTPLKR